MTEYEDVGTFGSVHFKLGNVRPSTRASTVKSNMGKTFVEKTIPMRNTNDTVLRINGVITGLSQTSAQTQAQAIETDRDALDALDDGYKHAYSDGRFSGDFVIVKGSLTWEDSANRSTGEPHKFSFELISW